MLSDDDEIMESHISYVNFDIIVHRLRSILPYFPGGAKTLGIGISTCLL